jgi:DNA-binding response OmpR family regulator
MSNTSTMKRKSEKRNNRKKILVVEDEGAMGLVLDMVLNERKFQLDYVNNLLAADEYNSFDHYTGQ